MSLDITSLDLHNRDLISRSHFTELQVGYSNPNSHYTPWALSWFHPSSAWIAQDHKLRHARRLYSQNRTCAHNGRTSSLIPRISIIYGQGSSSLTFCVPICLSATLRHSSRFQQSSLALWDTYPFVLVQKISQIWSSGKSPLHPQSDGRLPVLSSTRR